MSETHVPNLPTHPFEAASPGQPFSETGSRLDPVGYEVLSELGRGGMGVVYKARQKRLQRLVALKMILHADHAGPTDRVRFQREAEALATLHHENIVQVYEIGEHEGKPFLSLELIDGGNLARRLQDGPLKQQEAAALVEKLARAMQTAHDVGIIHRDLTPANVLLAEGGALAPRVPSNSRSELTTIPKITDFGLAKKLDEAGLSASGAIMGTPSYMAPEQATGRIDAMDARTDVYALGAILYECLTGRPPFRAATVMDTLMQVVGEEAAAVRSLQPGVAVDLETICLKCLRKEPERRYRSANELADDLGRYLRGEPVLARPVSRLERGRRWCKRNPAVASLLALVAILLVVGTAISTAFGIGEHRARKDAEVAKADALTKAELEEKARVRAEGEERRAKEQLYVYRLAMAQNLWDDGKAGAARDTLEQAQEYRERWEHRYLYALMHHRGQRTFLGHSRDVNSVCYSPDGKRIVSGSSGTGHGPGEVKVWDVSSGREVLALTGHRGSITNVCYSPDGKWIAAAAEKTSQTVVKVWDAASGKEHLTLLMTRAKSPTCVCFSPDSLRVAALTGDKPVRVWDVVDGRERFSFQGDDRYQVYGVCFSPNGKRIATWGPGYVKLWDASSGEGLRAFRISLGTQSFCFSPDGSKFAGVTFNHFVGVWDAQSGKELLRFPADPRAVRAVAFRPDSRGIASAGNDGAVRVWDAFTGKEQRTLKGHTQYVNSVHFSPDGRWIVSGGADGTVKVWDAAAGQEPLTIRGHSNQISSTSFSPDGKRVASAGQSRELKVWDAFSGEQLLSLIGDTNTASVCYSPEGTRLASADSGGQAPRLRIWDARTGQLLRTFKGHTGAIRAIAFSPDGKWIASGANDKKLIVRDASTGEERFTFEYGSNVASSLRFSPDGKRLAAAGSGLRVWDTVTWKPQFTIGKIIVNHPNRLAFSPDGRLLACGIQSRAFGEVRVYDAASGEEKFSLRGHSAEVNSVDYSPDGKRMLSASLDGTAILWDASTGQAMLTLRAHDREINSAGFSPVGERMVTAGEDGTIKIWDASVGQTSPVFKADTGHISYYCFSPDGKQVAFAVSPSRWPGLLKVWDIAGGREVMNLTGFRKFVWSLCYTADGKKIIAGIGDGTVWVWDAATGKALLTIEADPTLAISQVWASADGKRIASTTMSGEDGVRLWDSESGKELFTLKGHAAGALALDFSADGKRIVTGGHDRTVKVWDAADGKELLTLDGHAETVVHVAFTPDGKRVVSRDTGGEEMTWDLATGQPIPGSRVQVADARFRSPDGRFMVDRDGPTLRLHRIPSESPLKRGDGRSWADPDPLWHDQQASEAFEAADWSAVVFHTERVLRERPWDANQHVRHAYALGRLGRAADAALSYTRAMLISPAVRLWPGDDSAFARARTAAEAGEWGTAAADFELHAHKTMMRRPGAQGKVTQFELNGRAQAWGDVCLTQLACGRLTDARESVQLILDLAEKDKQNARVLLYTILLCPCEEQDTRRLVERARQFVAAKRDDTSTFLLGMVLYRAGQLEEAKRAFAESDALQGKGGYSEAHLFQAMLHQRLGRGEAARALLARFEKEHRFPDLADWRQRLRVNLLHDEAKRLIFTMPRVSGEQ